MSYASFWQRLGAFLLDSVCLLPLPALIIWLSGISRHFELWYFIPGIVIGLWFHVDLVKRFGGTPGKLLVGIRIRKIDGSEVGYKEAFLRYAVLLALSISSSTTIMLGTLQMSDAEYFSLDWQQRALRQQQLARSWYEWVHTLTNLWVWSEFIVMLTNAKRRAIHDFMAGTVVIRIAGARQGVPADRPRPSGSAGV